MPRALLTTLVLAVSSLMACRQPASPTETSGLTGLVMRGPITPVCQIQIPCSAPFSADFSVEQNGRSVARFHSGADGRFTVMLTAGTYLIVPDATAPIMFPQSQVKTVEVRSGALTEVQLAFDTGIR